MAFLKSVKTFVMGVVKGIQESQYKKALAYTRTTRLDSYIKSKGCTDTACVEYWIKEFEKKESRYGFN